MEQKRLSIFAERFASLRGNMTQEEFAEVLGISRPTVGFYENGTRLPDALLLRNIADKCQVSADWLIGLSSERTTDVEVKKISNYTGLTTPAIRALSEKKNQHPLIDVYNYLLENGALLRYIVNYFADFTLSALTRSPYKHIPLKPGSLYDFYQDVHFATVVRFLQAHREKFTKKYKGDKEFEEKAILNFLYSHADLEECREIIGETDISYDDFQDDFIDIEDVEWPEIDDDYQDSIRREIEEDEKARQEELDAIKSFLQTIKDYNK